MSTCNEASKKRADGHLRILILLSLAGFVWPGSAVGQIERTARPPDALHQLNDAIEALIQRVSPSVVQILVTGYGSTEDNDRGQTTAVIGRRRVIGSGVIVDAEGYIVTNAHVVSGAQNIEVIVPPRPASAATPDPDQDSQGKSYRAQIVGVAKEIDLAVIKIEAHAMPALSIGGSIAAVRQGEMVFAFGSPEGLRNTVTMGVVSAAARS